MVLRERKRLFESDPILKGVEDVEKVSADEIDADELAGSLEKDIDHLKVLGIHEKKVIKKLRRIQEAKKRLKRRLLKKL
tara:strand:+ start:356 stop:592 length:237 start_codon:yes stop_codon:yes gene_type:complete